jgi:hypothetical protein
MAQLHPKTLLSIFAAIFVVVGLAAESALIGLLVGAVISGLLALLFRRRSGQHAD